MVKQEITAMLLETHKEFVAHIKALSDEDFMFSNNGKWTAGQQLEHIYRSVFPIERVTGDPNFKINAPFGKSDHASVDYDTIGRNYITGLGTGFTAIGKFAPGVVTLEQRETFVEKLNQLLSKLAVNLDNYSEEELDTYILPHPFLGNLTIREMLYLINYHCKHHQQMILKNLGRAGE